MGDVTRDTVVLVQCVREDLMYLCNCVFGHCKVNAQLKLIESMGGVRLGVFIFPSWDWGVVSPIGLGLLRDVCICDVGVVGIANCISLHR